MSQKIHKPRTKDPYETTRIQWKVRVIIFLLGMYGNEGFFTWDENVCSESKKQLNDVTPIWGN